LPFALLIGVSAHPLAMAGPPTRTRTVAPAVTAAPVESLDVETLLQRLSALSDLIGREPQSASSWRLEIEQAEIMEQMAARSTGADRDNWLRMAADSYCSAAGISPASETEAKTRLAQLPARIAGTYPESPTAAYAALRIIQVDYLRHIAENPNDSTPAVTQRCAALEAFAAAYPRSKDAPGVVLDAARTYEKLGRTDDARRCYHYLAEHFKGHTLAREATCALWRLAGPGTLVHLDQPLLYAAGNSAGATLAPEKLRGKVVVAYFWSSKAPQAASDLQTLRDLSDRYQDQGLEVISVNVDPDAAQGRAFLAGQLTAGVHLHQPGGSEGATDSYGLTKFPTAILIAPDGTLARYSLPASQVEREVTKRLHSDH
jgi:hypothetical protein